ncbi:hypothetical protein Trydic_g14866 [Trypoxylus dichotomus]
MKTFHSPDIMKIKAKREIGELSSLSAALRYVRRHDEVAAGDSRRTENLMTFDETCLIAANDVGRASDGRFSLLPLLICFVNAKFVESLFGINDSLFVLTPVFHYSRIRRVLSFLKRTSSN